MAPRDELQERVGGNQRLAEREVHGRAGAGETGLPLDVLDSGIGRIGANHDQAVWVVEGGPELEQRDRLDAAGREPEHREAAGQVQVSVVFDGMFWPHQNGFGWPHSWAMWVIVSGGVGKERFGLAPPLSSDCKPRGHGVRPPIGEHPGEDLAEPCDVLGWRLDDGLDLALVQSKALQRLGVQ